MEDRAREIRGIARGARATGGRWQTGRAGLQPEGVKSRKGTDTAGVGRWEYVRVAGFVLRTKGQTVPSFREREDRKSDSRTFGSLQKAESDAPEHKLSIRRSKGPPAPGRWRRCGRYCLALPILVACRRPRAIRHSLRRFAADDWKRTQLWQARPCRVTSWRRTSSSKKRERDRQVALHHLQGKVRED